MGAIKTLTITTVVAAIGAGAFAYSGMFNIAADDPHWPLTYSLMETVRDRSIGVRAADIAAPDLSDPALISSGAGNYGSMCTSCHLYPGAAETELSLGLYPKPPGWSELGSTDPAEAFWVIKHGIKMSGMPAWGKSMDDQYIWGMVAFIGQFPGMTAAQYGAAVNASPGHSHGGGESNVGGGHSGDHHGSASSERSSFEPPDDPMADGDAHDQHDAPESDQRENGGEHQH